ncbi:MAG: metallophosphoesterase family protein [Bacteroidales bacterium]|nr:metallophosphoesterase family protein [Bacteroidales bacterium]
MKKLFLAAVAVSMASIALNAQNITFGPLVHQATDNSFYVIWDTDVESIGWVETAPDDDVHFYGEARPKVFDSKLGRKTIGTHHVVKMTGLTPGTVYRYRVVNTEVKENNPNSTIVYGKSFGTSVYGRQPFRVKTFNPDAESTWFAVGNDFHDEDGEVRALFGDAKEQGYDFVCFNGDMTSSVNNMERIFDNYLKTSCETFASEIPLVFARGNHETRGNMAVDLFKYYPTDTGLPYYTFKSGPVFFIVLDGGEDKPDSDIEYYGQADFASYVAQEAAWLAEVVESEEFKAADQKIVFCHIPPVVNGWEGERRLYSQIVPLLNKGGIDLMICGHDHSFYFHKKGAIKGIEFPILVNAQCARVQVKADKKNISINILKDGTEKKLQVKK